MLIFCFFVFTKKSFDENLRVWQEEHEAKARAALKYQDLKRKLREIDERLKNTNT